MVSVSLSGRTANKPTVKPTSTGGKAMRRPGFGWKAKLLVLISVVFASTLLADGSLAAAKKITVLCESDFLDFRMETAKMFEQRTGIDVEIIPVAYDNLYNKIVASAASGEAAYDVFPLDLIWTAQFAVSGFVEDITNRVPEQMREELVKASLDGVSYKGRIWGLPIHNNAKFFLYNERILKEIGAAPPKTWDELVSISKRLQQAGKVKYGTIWGWSQSEGLVCDYVMLTAAFGGRLFSADGDPIMNTGGALKALEFMVDSIYKDKISDPASITVGDRDMLNAFMQGDVAFITNWSYAWKEVNDPAKSRVAGDIRIGLIPGSENTKSGTVMGCFGFAIAKNSKNKDAAWEYLKFLTSKDVQKLYASKYGSLPVWQPLYNDPELVNKVPAIAQYGEQMKYGANRPSLTWYSEFSRVMQIELQNALTQKKSPKKAMDDAVAALKALKAKYEK